MADEPLRNANIPQQNLHNVTKVSSQEQSFANSLRTSIRRVSNLYEQTSKIYSKMGCKETPDDKEENLFLDYDKAKDKTKTSDLGISISKPYDEGTSFWATLFIYIKINVVAGFLFLPNGFLLGGWLFSVASILLVAVIVGYCNIALASCSEEAKSYSFPVIGFKAFGNYGKYMVEYGIAFSQICFPCSYVNLIATIVGLLLSEWFGIQNDKYYWLIGFVLLLILIPLCLLRNISAFTQMHIIGDIAVLSTIIALLVNSIGIISKDSIDISKYKLIDSGWSKILAMSVTCLEGVGVILPIKESMREKDQFNKIVYLGMSIIVLILIGFPLVAFFSYGSLTPEIVIQILPFDKIYMQVVMLLLIFSVIVVYPVQLYPAFMIFQQNFIFCKDNKITYQNILRMSILIITIVVGITSINRFATLMALFGCAICTPIALIMPTVFHYQLYKGKQSSFRSYCDLSIAFLGVGISITILVFTFI